MKYEVLKETTFTPAGGESVTWEQGKIVEMDESVAAGLIADGVIQLVENQEEDTVEEKKKEEGATNVDPTATKDADTDEVADTEIADVVPKKMFGKLEVISDGFREVNDKQYRHIRVADGSEYDLTEEEYADKVITE